LSLSVGKVRPFGQWHDYKWRAKMLTMKQEEKNKALVLEAFDTLFNKRDYTAAERFWSSNYIQHSAHIPPGREGLFNLVKASPLSLKYEHGLMMADGDFVFVHGKYSNTGLPVNWIIVDIARIENGVLVEHWDVIQDEATKEQSKSGMPMFGTSFPKSGQQSAPLTAEQARTIVSPLYDALNEPARKDVQALLTKAAHPDYRSYHTNEEFLTRDQLAEIFKNMGATIPDLRWEIKDIQVNGDQVVVRGEATGMPTSEFWGAKPTGKGFKTMAIDIFTVKNGKLASCYHVENWMTALQQIRK
jgi:predicted SnoaL-like aldol condensation-catalyzing enzyme/predicted ester cyclase